MYLFLLLFWILLNGKFTLEILLFGIVICAGVYAFLCKFMDFSIRKDLCIAGSLGQLIIYFLVLVKEIWIANINVLKLVYSPSLEPEPELVHFHTDLQTGIGKVLLANSITLTPGTITVSMNGDEFVVHCLDKSFAEGIDSSVFVDMLHKLEKSWKGVLS